VRANTNVHDEVVLHQNDLKPKSQGVGYHVSGFLLEKVGRLKITRKQWGA